MSRRRQLQQREGERVRYGAPRDERTTTPKPRRAPRPSTIAWLKRPVHLLPNSRLRVLGVASDAPGGVLLLREWEKRSAEEGT